MNRQTGDLETVYGRSPVFVGCVFIMNFYDLVKRSKPFLSLDISVQSTGYFGWNGTTFGFGTYALQSTNSYDRRKEFGDFVKKLVVGCRPAVIYQEDVIMGCNFETTRALTELNCVADNLMMYNQIQHIPLVRVNNSTWKRILRVLGGSTPVKGSGDKEEVRLLLQAMGFDHDVKQDVYDAVGIGLSQLAVEYLGIEAEQKTSKSTVRHLREDLGKGYVLEQCFSEVELLQKAESMSKRAKTSRPVVQIVFDPNFRSLNDRFKEIVREVGDNAIFAVMYPINKINNIALTHGFDLSQDMVYFIAKRR